MYTFKDVYGDSMGISTSEKTIVDEDIRETNAGTGETTETNKPSIPTTDKGLMFWLVMLFIIVVAWHFLG